MPPLGVFLSLPCRLRDAFEPPVAHLATSAVSVRRPQVLPVWERPRAFAPLLLPRRRARPAETIQFSIPVIATGIRICATSFAAVPTITKCHLPFLSTNVPTPQELDGHRGQKADWRVVREIRQVVVASRKRLCLAFPDVVLRDLVTRFEVLWHRRALPRRSPPSVLMNCWMNWFTWRRGKADVRSFDFGFSRRSASP